MSDDKHENESGSHEHEDHGHEHGGGHGKPLPDDSPPQNGLIFFYTVLTVCALIGLKFTMDWFLDHSRRETRAGLLEESVASGRLEEHRQHARETLSGGERPIDRVIGDLAERGRGAFPQVRPYPSADRGALEGWNRRAPQASPETPEPELAR